MKASGLKKPTHVEKTNPEASADNAPVAKPAKTTESAPKVAKAADAAPKVAKAADAAPKVAKAADAAAKSVKAAAADSAAKATPAAEAAPENDPIGLTVQYRDALGGPNNQITDIEAQKKKMKVFRAPKLLSKGTNFIDFVGENDKQEPSTDASNAKPPASAAAGISKIKKAVSVTAAATKVIIAAKGTAVKKTTEETSVTVNENLAGANDPIAQAM